MPEAGWIIGHSIGWPRNIGGIGIVSIMALVDAVEAEEIGGWTSGCGRLLVRPCCGGGVVTQRGQRAACNINRLSEDVVVDNKASKLQVRVRDGAVGILE